MEVTGLRPKASGLAKQDRFCQPCNDEPDGEHIPAMGYCRQCNEFICGPCIKCHRKSKASKLHEILEGDDMPEFTLEEDASDVGSYESCEIHSSPGVTVLVKFYCVGHDQVGCAECMHLDHKTCTTEYIQDVAKKERAILQKTLTSVDNRVEEYQTTVKQVYEANVCDDVKAKEDIQACKTEIMTYIEEKAEEMMGEIDNNKETDERKQKARIADCLQTKKEITDVKDQIESANDNVDKDFDELKHSKSLLQKIEKRIEDLETDHAPNRRRYTFQRDSVVARMLASKKPLGTLVSISNRDISKATLTRDADINILCNSIMNSVYSITGMELVTPRSLLIADCNGHTVIAVDLTTNKIQSHLKLSSGPWDLAVLPNNEIAVTLVNEPKIQILAFQKGSLSKVRDFKVSGQCRGIAYNNNMLVVTYDTAAKVELMDLNGHVIKCIETHNGGKLFQNPQYATFTTGGDNILVSDYGMNTITRLSSQGQVLAVHKLNEDVTGARGIFCCPDGTILVCGTDTHNIQVLSQDGTPLRVIRTQDDGIRYPCVVAVSDDMDTMYIGCENDPAVKVYKLTYK